MGNVSCTWLGTNSLRIETNDTILAIDPFIELPDGEHKNKSEDFTTADAYLITHPHLDHISSIAKLETIKATPVYTTISGVSDLTEDGVPMKLIQEIAPGEKIAIGNFLFFISRGKHIVFDLPVILKSLRPSNLISHAKNLFPLLKMNRKYKENGETLFIDAFVEGKHLQIMGSLSLDPNTEYRTNADVLFLPFQGNSKLTEIALQVVSKLQPKKVFLTHFDNSFPPISSSVDTSLFEKKMEMLHPEIKLIKPEFGKSYSL